MVSLVIVVVIIFFAIIFIALITYIAIIGRIGWQFFKYNFPFLKRRGTHYLILGQDGRFKWIYDVFKSVWTWPNGTKTYISRKFDRIKQTAEPLIFLVQGYPTNPQLSELLPPEEMSELLNNIIKEQEVASKLEMELQEKKQGLLQKIVPNLTLVFAFAGFVLAILIFLGMNNLSQVLEQVMQAVNEVKPHIPEAVEALKNLPKQI